MARLLFREKLYLSKRGNFEVFISEDFAPYLTSLQRDGIRFLYRQFSKKRPGAILNSPAGHGKTVQVVLLLEALRSVLRPLASLVLCAEERLEHWRYHFHLWTVSAEEILNESFNAFSKKEVFVCPTSKMADMARRDWGVVVVEDLSMGSSLFKQLRPLKAKFKIWLTNITVLDHPSFLSSICDWIGLKDKVDLEFRKNQLSEPERVEKEIALDIFCQDLIFIETSQCFPLPDQENRNKLFERWESDKSVDRNSYFNYSYFVDNATEVIESSHVESENIPRSKRNELVNPLKTPLNGKESHNVVFSPTSHAEIVKPNEPIIDGTIEAAPDIFKSINKISKKNKDATGLKVKRTKTPMYVDRDTFVNVNPESIIADHDNVAEEVVNKMPRLSDNIKDNQRVEVASESARDFFNEDHELVKNICNSNTTFMDLNYCTITTKATRANVDLSTSTSDIEMHNTTDADEIMSECKTKLSIGINKKKDLKRPADKMNDFEEDFSQKTKDLKASIKRIEDQTNKQFKGSFLDSLF